MSQIDHRPPLCAPPESDARDDESATGSHLQVDSISSRKLRQFPDFLILGPQRTGTTWLYHNLKKHPQVFLPEAKETYYFSTLGRESHRHHRFASLDEFLDDAMGEPKRRWLKRQYDSLRKYRERYRPAMRGEATASNALLPVSVIREITAIRPGLKAILMLRNPVERAWSHARKDLVRKTGSQLQQASRAEFEKFFRTAGQRALASYAAQIRRWNGCLKPGHLFIGEFEMIASSPERLITRIHRFLGIRSGSRYFNRHLRERINSSAGQAKKGHRDIPPAIREHLEGLLADELQAYYQIRAKLDPSAFHRAIRQRPVDFRGQPETSTSRRLETAA